MASPIELVAWGTIAVAAVGAYYSLVYKPKTSTEHAIDLNDQANIILDTAECSGCTPYGGWDKGGGFAVFKVKMPNGKVLVKKYHESDLVANPLDILRGTFHVREKRAVPASVVYDDVIEAEDAEEVVKQRVTSPVRDFQLEKDQGEFLKKLKETFGSSEDDLATEPSDEEVEAAVKPKLKTSVNHKGTPLFFKDGVRIKKADYDRLMAEGSGG